MASGVGARRWLLVAAGLAFGACAPAARVAPSPLVDAGAAPFKPYAPATPPANDGGGAGAPSTGAGGQAGQRMPPGAGGAVAGQGGGTAGRTASSVLESFHPVAIDEARGEIVVGNLMTSGRRAVLWNTMTGVITQLPTLEGTQIALTDARGSSRDGQVVVGWASAGGKSQAVRWTGANSIERLGVARPDDDASIAFAVSADGSAATGSSLHGQAAVSLERAFLWKDGTMRAIEPLPGDVGTSGALISADGSTVVGYSFDAVNQRRRTFSWTLATGIVEVLPPAGTVFGMLPRALSADGSVLVGEAIDGRIPYRDDPLPDDLGGVPRHAFRWTTKGGTQLFGPMTAGKSSRATHVSPDGVLVLGTEFEMTAGIAEVHARPFLVTNGSLQVLDTGGSDVASVVMDAAGTLVVALAGDGTAGLMGWRVTRDGKPAAFIPVLGPIPASTGPRSLVAISVAGNKVLGCDGADCISSSASGWFASLLP